MRHDEFLQNRRNLADRFENIFQRLLAGEKFDFYGTDTELLIDLSFMFEFIASNLLAKVPERQYHWYDGVDGLTAAIRKSRQVEFKGEMWVGDDRGKMWKEDFRARVTDKRVTKQGIWITLWIGSDRAEEELLTAFGLSQ